MLLDLFAALVFMENKLYINDENVFCYTVMAKSSNTVLCYSVIA